MATVTATWNTTDGDWFLAANWDETNPAPPPPLLHNVPGSTTDVSIPDNSGTNSPTPFTVSYDGTSTINTLTGSIVGTLDITGGSLTVLNGGGFDLMAINVAAGASLNVSTDTLVVTGGSYGGTLAGAGGIRFIYGSFTLDPGAAVSVANWELGVSGNGTVSQTTLNTSLTYANNFTLADLSGNHAVLDLDGNTFTLSGTGVIDGTIDGPGIFRVTGSADEGSSAYGSATVTGGTILRYMPGSTGTQHNNAFLGNGSTTGTLAIKAGATYTMTETSLLGSTVPFNAFVNNGGTFAVDGAGIVATVGARFASTGTVTVAAGDTLNLRAWHTSSLAGTITGDGTVQISDGITTLAPASLSVGTLHINGGNGGAQVTLGSNLSTGSTIVYDGQFDTFSLGGHTLTLTGSASFYAGNLTGAGRLVVNGSADFGSVFSIGGPNMTGTAATVAINGTATQSGHVVLHGALRVNAGGSYTITSASQIFDQGATIINKGRLADSAAGTSDIAGTINNAGHMHVAAGSILQLHGTVTLGGTLTGAGTLVLGSGAATTITSTNITVAELSLAGGVFAGATTLAADLTYGGLFRMDNFFAALNLDGHTLTLDGKTSFAAGHINGLDGSVDRLVVTGSHTDLSAIIFGSWSDGADAVVLKGTAGGDKLVGSTVGDVIKGGAGGDKVHASSGNDQINGGAGYDHLYGDKGNDTINGDAGHDSLYGGSGDDRLDGGLNADLLSGNGGADLLLGGAGADRLLGGADSDTLIGANGNDTLNGGGGGDILKGGGGKDVLIGGNGQDFLTGGAGADSFVFNHLADSAVGAKRDHITDFVHGTDKVDVSGIDAKTGVAGDQAFHFITGAFTGHKGELHAVNSHGNSIVSGDVNGDGHADFSILVEHVTGMQAVDFVL